MVFLYAYFQGCLFGIGHPIVPGFPQLPVALWVGLRSHEFLPIHFGRPIGVLLAQLTFGLSCW